MFAHDGAFHAERCQDCAQGDSKCGTAGETGYEKVKRRGEQRRRHRVTMTDEGLNEMEGEKIEDQSRDNRNEVISE